DPAVAPEVVLTAVDQAFHRARGVPAGPVHLNCMFPQPLDPTPDGFDAAAYLTYQHAWLTSEAPFTDYLPSRHLPEDAALDATAAELSATGRAVLLAGQPDRPDDAAAAEQPGQALGWPVFPAIPSGLRLGDRSGLM